MNHPSGWFIDHTEPIKNIGFPETSVRSPRKVYKNGFRFKVSHARLLLKWKKNNFVTCYCTGNITNTALTMPVHRIRYNTFPQGGTLPVFLFELMYRLGNPENIHVYYEK